MEEKKKKDNTMAYSVDKHDCYNCLHAVYQVITQKI